MFAVPGVGRGGQRRGIPHSPHDQGPDPGSHRRPDPRPRRLNRPALLFRLLNDVEDNQDQLPVLQHALLRTWDLWQRSPQSGVAALDLEHYDATGGMHEALSRHADEIFDALPSGPHRTAAVRIFKAMTERGPDGRGIRRPTRLGQLVAIAAVEEPIVHGVIEAYRAPGVTFLMPPVSSTLDDDAVIDISHESLMRVWRRLRGWVEDEAQSARTYHRLRETAALHGEKRAGLYHDPDLQIALSWREASEPNSAWAGQVGGRFDEAMAFLDTSREAAEREENQREATRQRELERARQLAETQVRVAPCSSASPAAWRSLCASPWRWRSRRSRSVRRRNGRRPPPITTRSKRTPRRRWPATTRRRPKQRHGRHAKPSRKPRFVPQPRLRPNKTHAPPRRRAASCCTRPICNWPRLSGERSLHRPEASHPAGETHSRPPALDAGLRAPEGSPPSAPKPDLRGFEWYYYQHLLEDSAAVFSGHADSVVAGAFTADGPLVTLDQNGQLRRWDLGSQAEDPASRRDLPGGPGPVRVLSPDGRLAALAEGNKVRVFDTSTGHETFSIDSASRIHRRLIFSRDGDRLVIVDDKIRWLSAASGEVIASLEEKVNRIECLALSADGLTLAVGGYGFLGDLASIFRLDAAAKTVTPLARGVGIRTESQGGSALTADGGWFVVGCNMDGNLAVFDAATGRLIARHPSAHASPILAIAFSGTARSWPRATPKGRSRSGPIFRSWTRRARRSRRSRAIKGPSTQSVSRAMASGSSPPAPTRQPESGISRMPAQPFGRWNVFPLMGRPWPAFRRMAN